MGDAVGDEKGVAFGCGFDVVGPSHSWDGEDEEDRRVVIVGQPHVLAVDGQHRDAVLLERLDPHQTSVFQITSQVVIWNIPWLAKRSGSTCDLLLRVPSLGASEILDFEIRSCGPALVRVTTAHVGERWITTRVGAGSFDELVETD